MTKKLKVTLKKSGINRPKRQKSTLKALGLTKLNKSKELEDSPVIRGMIDRVQHLLSIEEQS